MTDEEKITEVLVILDDCWIVSDESLCGACALCVETQEAHANTLVTTIGKADWAYCTKHRIAWCYGYGNSSCWALGREGQIWNARRMDGFAVIDSKGKHAGCVFEADAAIEWIEEFWNRP